MDTRHTTITTIPVASPNETYVYVSCWHPAQVATCAG